jgi:SNF2 family DNA or RNA helicase
MLGLKMGVLAGTKIWGHATTEDARIKTVERLNAKTLNGIVMTDKVGACGHNLVGANKMIFIGSLYSQAFEEQAIGDSRLTNSN